MASPIKVVLAFDFGTTYSGVSYAYRKPGATPTPIIRWPGDSGRFSTEVKVPTIISYNGPTDFKWGYQVKPTDKSTVGIKLLLDPDQDKPSYLPGSGKKTALRNLPKPAVDIAADYIGAVYKHALEQIRTSSVGNFFDTCEREAFLLSPLCGRTKPRTSRFRLGSVSMIKEPEAAAIYTLSEQSLALQKGDICLICDAGGGTVDLITYEVAQSSPLELAEVVPGSGGMAGAIGLNKRFEDAVRELIGDSDMGTFKSMPDGWAIVLNQFETEIKRNFSGESNETHYIPLSWPETRRQPGREPGEQHLEHEVIFDPLVRDVIRLIDDQVQASRQKYPSRPIKAIFLVGGFGSNAYLKGRIEKSYQVTQVVQPANASSAIMDGAVMHCLTHGPKIVSRRATCHYGVKGWFVQRIPEDIGKRTWYDDKDGITRVKRMGWNIIKGQELKEEKIKISFVHTADDPYTHADMLIDQTLYFSKTHSPQVYPDDDVIKCCRLKASLWSARYYMRKIPVGAHGKPYWILNYGVVVTAKANLHFSLEVNGKEYGSVEASFQ
ncbi:Hsp70 family protein [Apiospora aurea]|uniref:Hsp70 family protein n=1 Tax=Apiospora aurea TaxID=335848 RepID=A0ABR1Q412_9PEZI